MINLFKFAIVVVAIAAAIAGFLYYFAEPADYTTPNYLGAYLPDVIIEKSFCVTTQNRSVCELELESGVKCIFFHSSTNDEMALDCTWPSEHYVP